ncbi:hypothetical protein [Streptomyces sp. NPDC014734]
MDPHHVQRLAAGRSRAEDVASALPPAVLGSRGLLRDRSSDNYP